MSEEIMKPKIIIMKNTHIKSLKVKGLIPKLIVIKNLTLKNVAFYGAKQKCYLIEATVKNKD